MLLRSILGVEDSSPGVLLRPDVHLRRLGQLAAAGGSWELLLPSAALELRLRGSAKT